MRRNLYILFGRKEMTKKTLLEEPSLDKLETSILDNWDTVGRKLLPGDGPKQAIVDYPENPKIIKIDKHSPFGNPSSPPIKITKDAVDKLLQMRFLRQDKVGTWRRRIVMTLTQAGKVHFITHNSMGEILRPNPWMESNQQFFTARRF